MKCYISGKITGCDAPEQKFEIAKYDVGLRLGLVPVNPMEIPVTVHPSNDEPDWTDYMMSDIDVLMRQCTAIYMLKDWRDSKGARIEHAIAEILGLDIYYDEIGTHEENNISESV